MRIDIHIHDDRSGEKLDCIIGLLQAILAKEMKMSATLDEVLSDVQDESTVIDSVETLLKGLSDQLAAAIAANDPAKIQAVKDAIDANKARLAAAVVAGTPAAIPPVP